MRLDGEDCGIIGKKEVGIGKWSRVCVTIDKDISMRETVYSIGEGVPVIELGSVNKDDTI